MKSTLCAVMEDICNILLSKINHNDAYVPTQAAIAVYQNRNKGTKWNTMPKMVLERLKEVLLLALHNTPTDEQKL